ncbi:MAG: argininosuccinate lyase [Acidimicrobiia bacterium]|nr:argininosuccinate lyase [Acidimicrobiia bacterium]
MTGATDRGPTDRRELWHGRFSGGPSEALQALNDSLSFDRRLYREDIAGSRAHIGMLLEVGLLDEEEHGVVVAALDQVEAEIDDGSIAFAGGDEDIHTLVERRVTEIAGPAGAKLHTGRSRNDQVATDLRLWTKRSLTDVVGHTLGLQATLLAMAERAGDAYLPGYTHLQQAQPVLLAHHLLAHGWALARDVDRLIDARTRVDVSPLGAGALAGSSLPLDPHRSADALGFESVFDNSLDAVSDRDFVAESLFALSLLGVHLSRIGEELILWASSEFGFVTLDDAFSTGSSMMPQKKNPDIAELARGKAGRLIGHLTGFLATLKGLPLAYNKDLQGDKEPLFDAVDTVRLTLLALDGMLSTLSFDHQAMAAGADSPYAAATDLAEWLVERGTPFRDAHAVVGVLVRRSLAGEAPFADLVRSEADLGPDAAALIAPGASVTRRVTHGAGGPDAVGAQIERFRTRMALDQARV